MFARGSIVADRELEPGQVLTEVDIWARRPGNGEIPANQFDSLLGRRIRNRVPFNKQLKWSDLD